MIKKNLEETAYQASLLEIDDFLFETELTRQLNMRSRTPVRHALTKLVAKGFLVKNRNEATTYLFRAVMTPVMSFLPESISRGSTLLMPLACALKKILIRILLEDEAETGQLG